MENLGLGIKLQFDQGNSVAQMGAVNSTLTNLKNGFTSLGQGLDNLVGGFAKLTAIGGGITVLFGLGASQAMNYERKLSSLRALIRQSSTDVEGDMQRLTRGTIDVGGTMFFVNSEIVEVEESMARFGLTSTEILEALPAALRMASAEGMDAADAANSLLTVMRQFDLPFTEAQNVTDQLAKTSAITATTMEELSYGLQYVSSSGNLMGESVTDVITLLGLLADAGHRGSSGGMALNQAYEQISKMTPKAQRALARIGLTARDFKDSEGNFIGMIDTFRLLGSHITNISGNFDRATVLQDIFSVRGRRAVAPLLRMVQDVGSRFETVREQIAGSAGTADQMARDRMNNFYTMIKRIPQILMEIINTRFFLDLLEPLRLAFKPIVDLLYDIAQAMNETKSPTNEVSKTAWSIAAGLKDARGVLMGMIQKADELKDKFIQAFSVFSGGKGSSKDENNPLRKFVKDLTLAAPIIIGLTALMGGLGIIGLFLSGIAAVGGALATILPYLAIALAVIGGGILISKKEGESWGDTFSRQFERIKAIGRDLKSFFIGLAESVVYVWEWGNKSFGKFTTNLSDLGSAFGVLFDMWGIGTEESMSNFELMGKICGGALALVIWPLQGIIWLLKYIPLIIALVAAAFYDMYQVVVNLITNIHSAMDNFVAELCNGFIRISNIVIRHVGEMVFSMSRAIGRFIEGIGSVIGDSLFEDIFGTSANNMSGSFNLLANDARHWGDNPDLTHYGQREYIDNAENTGEVSRILSMWGNRNNVPTPEPVKYGTAPMSDGSGAIGENYDIGMSIQKGFDIAALNLGNQSMPDVEINFQINNNLDSKKLNDAVKGQQANNNNRHGRRNNGSDGSNETPWQRTMIIENNFV